MRTIAPLHAAGIHEPEIRLVRERRGLQCDVGAFAAHMTPGQPAQLGVNERCQLVERAGISLTPSQQELRNRSGRETTHEPTRVDSTPEATPKVRIGRVRIFPEAFRLPRWRRTWDCRRPALRRS